jgi:hypothetical protein
MRILCVAAISLAVAACTTAPPQYPTFKYAKPGGTYQEYLEARHDCLLEARKQTTRTAYVGNLGAGVSDQQISGGVLVACLSARGWLQDPNGFGPPPGGAILVGP